MYLKQTLNKCKEKLFFVEKSFINYVVLNAKVQVKRKLRKPSTIQPCQKIQDYSQSLGLENGTGLTQLHFPKKVKLSFGNSSQYHSHYVIYYLFGGFFQSCINTAGIGNKFGRRCAQIHLLIHAFHISKFHYVVYF